MYHAVHYIPSNSLPYNWTFVCFDHVHPISPPLTLSMSYVIKDMTLNISYKPIQRG